MKQLLGVYSLELNIPETVEREKDFVITYSMVRTESWSNNPLGSTVMAFEDRSLQEKVYTVLTDGHQTRISLTRKPSCCIKVLETS